MMIDGVKVSDLFDAYKAATAAGDD
jgi:hypothetical protein